MPVLRRRKKKKPGTTWGWHPETLVCSRRGHTTPAAEVEHLRPEDVELGTELADGRRLSRCTRCDVWVEHEPPANPKRETLPPLAELPIPRRGRALRDAIVLRIIAIDRGVHSVLFGALAALLILIDLNLGNLRHQAENIIESIAGPKGQGISSGFIVTELHRLLNLHHRTLLILIATALAYFVVEGVEAVGLWKERRWAEYLTVVATTGFIPFEIKALIDKVTTLRVSALIINVAIVAWLLWRKRLFGIRGGPAAEEKPDPVQLFGPKEPAASRTREPASRQT